MKNEERAQAKVLYFSTTELSANRGVSKSKRMLSLDEGSLIRDRMQ
jgi:hypothetical protein